MHRKRPRGVPPPAASKPTSAPPLVAGRNCWRLTTADQAGVLVDACAYFGAVREAILEARSTLYIVGWDLHSATRLVRDGDDGASTLRGVIGEAVTRNPRLQVYILLWDWAVLYAGERELLPRVNLDWRLPPQVRLELDGAVPLGASQHQKLVVVDDAVAFCGGLDLTVRRWDRRAHRPDEQARVDHEGIPFAPYHDVQVVVSGAAAACLGTEVRRRWQVATGEYPARPATSARTDVTAALARAAVVLDDMPVAIARTVPDIDPALAIGEVRDALLDTIAGAMRHIYIENQFVCADVVARALAARLRAVPELEVLIVTPRDHKGWFEARSMGAGRARFLHHLAAAGVLDRVRIVYPVLRTDGGEDDEVFIHSKVMIIDDCVLRVGSANLNNRSMGYDSECDLLLLGNDARQRSAISAVLHDLLAEHLGRTPAQVAATLARHGLLATVRTLDHGRRGFASLEQAATAGSFGEDLYISLADPERPVALRDFLPLIGDDGGDATDAAEERRRTALPLVGVAVVCAVLTLLWRTTALSELVRPAAIEALLATLHAAPWMPLLVVGLFVGLSLLMVPVTALILATGVTFDALTGFVCALTGSLLSAALGYGAGRCVDTARIMRRAGARLRPIANSVRRRGVLAMTTVRLLPVAPFTVVNLVAGAARVPFGDYLVGTALGMAPGIALLTAFGDSLAALVGGADWPRLLGAGALALAWIALAVGARRLRPRKAPE